MAPMRIGGLTSGLDSDKMVQDMMRAERMKVDRVEKERTRIEWTQMSMRELINKTRDFQGKFFDILKPETNMLSSAAFSSYTYSVLSEGQKTNAVQISVRAGALKTDNVIDRITQLATADTWSRNRSDIAVIKGKAVKTDQLATGKDLELMLSIGRVSKKITVKSDELAALTSVDELAAKMNEKIAQRFGSDYNAVVSAHDLGAEGKGLRLELKGTAVRVVNAGDAALFHHLGIQNGSGTYDYTKKDISDLLGITAEDLKDFSLNGKAIKLTTSMTMEEAFRAINSADVGINMHYDVLSDRVVMRSTGTGSVSNLEIENGSSAEKVLAKFLGTDDLVDANGELHSSATSVTREKGKNAVLTLNGTQIVKESNKFTLEGVTYTLNALSDKAIHTDATIDTDKVYDRIKSFVDDYNALITEIDKKLAEPKYRGFDPLTDDEKSALTEKQVEQYEEKAKSGLLNGNRDFGKMLDKIRSAIVDSVDGETLRSIGIQSNSWKDKGKLSIDPSKLKDAIRDDVEKVVNLFTKSSSISYTDEKNRKTRYEESGVMSRLDDVIKDFTRTTRDESGKKGALVMIAGLENDLSAVTNKMSEEMRDKDKRINEMLAYLTRREDYYYRMFAKMEAAMAQMQSQQNSFAGLMGGMNGAR